MMEKCSYDIFLNYLILFPEIVDRMTALVLHINIIL